MAWDIFYKIDVFDKIMLILAALWSLYGMSRFLYFALGDIIDEPRLFPGGERQKFVNILLTIGCTVAREILVFLTIVYLTDFQWDGAILVIFVNTVFWGNVHSRFSN